MAIDNLLMAKLLELTPQDKMALVEALISSLDNPDPAISQKWLQEADARLKAYKLGLTKGIPAEEIFGDDL
jgi:putative addiction module component (TIGR02574 family)